MLLNLTNYSSEPLDDQIVKQILLRVLEEDKMPGDELESIGKISRQHHIRKGSIEKAFEKLEQLGVIFKDKEHKYFISDVSTRELKHLIERNYHNSNHFSEYELFKTELNAARQIQNDLLPKNLPRSEEIDVAAYSTISDEVGGDFYDFFEVEKDKYAVLIGDASGKGFPAAMLISQIQAIIKSSLSSDRTLLQTVALINSYMNSYSSAKNFATLFYGLLDLKRGTINYINAGHNFPIILSGCKIIKRLKTTGPALGIITHANFTENEVNITSGDLFTLFTDGLPERINKENQQYGEKSLLKLMKCAAIILLKL